MAILESKPAEATVTGPLEAERRRLATLLAEVEKVIEKSPTTERLTVELYATGRVIREIASRYEQAGWKVDLVNTAGFALEAMSRDRP